jgi:hypothetical protein
MSSERLASLYMRAPATHSRRLRPPGHVPKWCSRPSSIGHQARFKTYLGSKRRAHQSSLVVRGRLARLCSTGTD